MGIEDTFADTTFESPQLHERYTTATEPKQLPLLDERGKLVPGGDAVLDAKKKRERLRAIGAPNATAANAKGDNEDFISLSLTKRPDDQEYSGPHPESRLMRGDDDLGDGEDGRPALLTCGLCTHRLWAV